MEDNKESRKVLKEIEQILFTYSIAVAIVLIIYFIIFWNT